MEKAQWHQSPGRPSSTLSSRLRADGEQDLKILLKIHFDLLGDVCYGLKKKRVKPTHCAPQTVTNISVRLFQLSKVFTVTCI